MRYLLFIIMLILLSTPTKSEAQNKNNENNCSSSAKSLVTNLNNVTNYEYHYSNKNSICYITVSYFNGNISEKTNGLTRIIKRPYVRRALYQSSDIILKGNFESIGSKVINCWVSNNNCNSIDEFESLLVPYLEQ